MLSTPRRLYVALILSSQGYFNAYGVAAHNTSADVFVHLGDYVSEACVLILCSNLGSKLDLRIARQWVSYNRIEIYLC